MVTISLASCDLLDQPACTSTRHTDSLQLVEMVLQREQAMTEKNVQGAISQFADNASWINSQGYYFEGKDEVEKFHAMLVGNDTTDYLYHAGIPRINIINSRTAIAYYSWKMLWYTKSTPADTTFREIGLMTLLAIKDQGHWKWVAVTNQHTPWFYERIEPVGID